MDLEPAQTGTTGDLIKPYLNKQGTHFERNFWMVDRLAAMAGALVEDYNRMNILIGMMGTGLKPLHFYVVGPDDTTKLPNEVMTSPGTPDCGWIPKGEDYEYDMTLPHSVNMKSWLAAGAPKWNSMGSWANGGLPLEYVRWSWENPSTRGESPLARKRHGGRGGRGR